MRTLPPESRLAFALHGEIVTWSPVNYQLASLMDMLGTRWAGRKWRTLRRPTVKSALPLPQMPVEEKRRRLASLRMREARRQADG